MKNVFNVLLYSIIVAGLACWAFGEATKVYRFVVDRDNSLSWYNEEIDVTCIQTLNPFAPGIFCLPGDRNKEAK